VLELNGLHPTLYVEPFVGGASVALHMLQLPSVEQIILMDADPWIASFWQTLFFDTAWLIEQVQAVEVTVERWIASSFAGARSVARSPSQSSGRSSGPIC